jgi:hypothetical protein
MWLLSWGNEATTQTRQQAAAGLSLIRLRLSHLNLSLG